MAIHTLSPDGTAYLIGLCADITDLYTATKAAVDDRLMLGLGIRPHARFEDLAEIGPVAHLVHELAIGWGHTALFDFARHPFEIRARFEVAR